MSRRYEETGKPAPRWSSRQDGERRHAYIPEEIELKSRPRKRSYRDLQGTGRVCTYGRQADQITEQLDGAEVRSAYGTHAKPSRKLASMDRPKTAAEGVQSAEQLGGRSGSLIREDSRPLEAERAPSETPARLDSHRLDKSQRVAVKASRSQQLEEHNQPSHKRRKLYSLQPPENSRELSYKVTQRQIHERRSMSREASQNQRLGPKERQASASRYL